MTLLVSQQTSCSLLRKVIYRCQTWRIVFISNDKTECTPKIMASFDRVYCLTYKWWFRRKIHVSIVPDLVPMLNSTSAPIFFNNHSLFLAKILKIMTTPDNSKIPPNVMAANWRHAARAYKMEGATHRLKSTFCISIIQFLRLRLSIRKSKRILYEHNALLSWIF